MCADKNDLLLFQVSIACSHAGISLKNMSNDESYQWVKYFTDWYQM